ncbi:hypothetical protein ACYPKM_05535 [Pseudomonas aeruginosa]
MAAYKDTAIIALALAIALMSGCSTKPGKTEPVARAFEVSVRPALRFNLNGQEADVVGFDECDGRQTLEDYLAPVNRCISFSKEDTSVKVMLTFPHESQAPGYRLYETWMIDRHVGFINLVRPNGDLAGRLHARSRH